MKIASSLRAIRLIHHLVKSGDKETPYVYFAPIIGAYKGIVREYATLERLERFKARRKK